MSAGDNVDVGVTAAATRGTAIGPSTKFTQVSVCGAGNGVMLPANPLLNQSTVVRNDGANSCSVWPANVLDQINGLGLGNPYALAAGTAARFFCTANTAAACQWFSEAVSAPQPVALDPQIAIAAVTPVALTVAQTGSAVNVTQQAGVIVINLPAVATSAGVKYKFAVAVAAAGNTQITAATNVIRGTVTNLSTGSTAINAVGNITFAGNVCRAGDWIELWSDGTNWYARGQSAIAAGIITV